MMMDLTLLLAMVDYCIVNDDDYSGDNDYNDDDDNEGEEPADGRVHRVRGGRQRRGGSSSVNLLQRHHSTHRQHWLGLFSSVFLNSNTVIC